MNWPVGGGWVSVVLALGCVALAVGWSWDRRRLRSETRQAGLMAEAESERLRLRISALKPLEGQIGLLRTDLAELTPTAERVPDLESQVEALRHEAAERDRAALELERELATLRGRVTDVDELELAAAKTASRSADLEQELAAATARLLELERVDAELAARIDEIQRLVGEAEVSAERQRDLSRELGALTATADQRGEALAVADARVEAAEALIARRDEIILVLEQRLADRDGAPPVHRNGSSGGRERPLADVEGDRPGRKKKLAKAERKKAKQRAKKAARAAAAYDAATAAARDDDAATAAARDDDAATAAARDDDAATAVARDDAAGTAHPSAAKSDPFPDVAGDDGGTTNGIGPTNGEATGGPDANGEVTDTNGEVSDSIGAGRRDDLQAINGIGPVMERVLNGLGIRRLAQLAALDEAEAADLSARLPGVPGRVEREGWVAQARRLVGETAAG